MTKLYSYVVARDFGFAPNPFHNTCTLATCKPLIRKTANENDWVVGTGSKSTDHGDKLIYAMKVTQTLNFTQYWNNPLFQQKKPFLLGSVKQAYGDNIYCKTPNGQWMQENSHHSYEGGQPNHHNIQHDTQVDRVLVSEDFVYFGGDGPIIPHALKQTLCKVGPGHKCCFEPEFAVAVVDWIRSLGVSGYQGKPINW